MICGSSKENQRLFTPNIIIIFVTWVHKGPGCCGLAYVDQCLILQVVYEGLFSDSCLANNHVLSHIAVIDQFASYFMGQHCYRYVFMKAVVITPKVLYRKEFMNSLQ